MAARTANLLLADLATGESGVLGYTNWGEAADDNFARLEDALTETSSITLAGVNVTLTDEQERSVNIVLTGTLSANVEVRTNDRKGFWFVYNNTNGAYTVTFKPTSGSGAVVPPGGRTLLICDGTNTAVVAGTQFADSAFRIVGSSDATKKVAFEVDGITAGQTRVITLPDYNITFGTAAGKNTGTSGDAVPLLNGANTWSGTADYTSGALYVTDSGGFTKLTKTAACLSIQNNNGIAAQFINNAGSAGSAVMVRSDRSDIGFFDFRTNAGSVGGITHNFSNTSYNTSSDYRLPWKAGYVPLAVARDSGAFIDALKPYFFPEVGQSGFIAHEFAETSPSSVTGEKDAVNEDGSPRYQSMQASSSDVMANIIAELQSLRRRVADQERRIAELEAVLAQ